MIGWLWHLVRFGHRPRWTLFQRGGALTQRRHCEVCGFIQERL